MQPEREMTQNCRRTGAALPPAAADQMTFKHGLKQVLLRDPNVFYFQPAHRDLFDVVRMIT